MHLEATILGVDFSIESLLVLSSLDLHGFLALAYIAVLKDFILWSFLYGALASLKGNLTVRTKRNIPGETLKECFLMSSSAKH